MQLIQKLTARIWRLIENLQTAQGLLLWKTAILAAVLSAAAAAVGWLRHQDPIVLFVIGLGTFASLLIIFPFLNSLSAYKDAKKLPILTARRVMLDGEITRLDQAVARIQPSLTATMNWFGQLRENTNHIRVHSLMERNLTVDALESAMESAAKTAEELGMSATTVPKFICPAIVPAPNRQAGVTEALMSGNPKYLEAIAGFIKESQELQSALQQFMQQHNRKSEQLSGEIFAEVRRLLGEPSGLSQR